MTNDMYMNIEMWVKNKRKKTHSVKVNTFKCTQ